MKVGRRRFLQVSATGTALLPIGLKLSGCGNNVQPAPIVHSTIGADGLVRVDVSRYPDLQPLGGAVTLVFDGLPTDTPYQDALRGLLLIHLRPSMDPAGPAFVCTQSACPHEGCPLGYSVADKLIECPCHASRFRSTDDPNDKIACIGRVLHLPATDDLSVYAVTYDGATQVATVDLNNPVECGGNAFLPAPVAGKVSLPFADYPQLQDTGGQVVGHPMGFADSLVVFRVDATTVRALSSVCTHLGCDVAYNPDNTRVECPCHGSLFTTDGVLIDGLAKRNLKEYPSTLTATGVDVSVG